MRRITPISPQLVIVLLLKTVAVLLLGYIFFYIALIANNWAAVMAALAGSILHGIICVNEKIFYKKIFIGIRSRRMKIFLNKIFHL